MAGGSATIAQAPGSTTINQSSARTVINWQSFNVGSAASVQFNQPSASAIALNRVVSPSPSIIAGQINANGQIVLINQSGVVVTKGADINAESVVLATSNIATKDFMAGKMAFSGAPDPGAKIVNDGNITVRDTGLVGLVAPRVENDGVITARLGQVVLAGASAFTLDLYGDRLISLDVTKAVRAVDVGGVLVPALVTNRGLILADGGKITLTARDADALVTQLIDAGGTIRADSVGQRAGTIAISGVGGDITIAGNLLARGSAAGSKGGNVEALTTGKVSVAPGALVDASGEAGGGVIAIGTDLNRAREGAADTAAPRAEAVTVADGAQIRADATKSGDAGRVVLLAEASTDFEGLISVQGGPAGGNGGTAEISSGGVINLGGTVHDLAAAGHSGQVLLDPATLAITGGSGSDANSFSGAGGTTLGDFGASGVSTISAASLASLSGTIILEASSLISVGADVGLTSASALSLFSHGDITIGAGISLAAGSLDIDAANTMFVGGALSATDITLQDVDVGGITIAAGVAASDSLRMIGGGPIDEVAGGYISAVSLSGGSSGDIELGSSLNNIIDLNGFGGSHLYLQDGVSTTITSALNAGSITLVTPQTLEIFAPVDASSGNVDLVANALILSGLDVVSAPASGTIAYAPFSPGALEFTASSNAFLSAGTIVLGSADGYEAAAVIVDGNESYSGSLKLAASDEVEQAGTLTASNLDISAGSIELDGLVTTAGALDLDATGDIADAGILSAATLAFGGAAFGQVTLAGPITAGLLTGSAASGVALGNLANDIGTLGAISISNGDFLLGNGVELTIDAPVQAQDILLADSGRGIGLGATGSLVAADRIALTSDAVSAATGARISANAVTLAPYSDLGIDLGGTDNNVLFLFQGVFNAAAGVPVLQIGDGGASIAANGAISANVGTLVLDASAIAITSTLDASGELALGASGAVSESQAGAIIAPSLAGFGTIGGALDLGSTGNRIASLLGVTASSIYLADEVALSVGEGSQATEDPSVRRADDAGLGLGGGISAGNVTLQAPGISFDTAVNVTGTLALASSAGITQLDGEAAISAGTLTSDGVTDEGDVDLSEVNIASLGAFSLGSGRFTLDDNVPLALTGALTAGNATLAAPGIAFNAPANVSGVLALISADGISQSAVITAGTLTSGGAVDQGGADLDENPNRIATLGAFSLGSGDFALEDVVALALAGPLSAPVIGLSAPSISIGAPVNAGSLAVLTAGGAITETAGGTLSAVTLTDGGGGIGSLDLGQANAIATLSGAAVTGAITLNDATPLTFSGDITAAGASLTAPSLDFTGTFISTQPLQLATASGVSEATGAVVSAPSLGGTNTGGNVALGGLNTIASLGDFAFGAGSFSLGDATNLVVAGTLSGGSAALAAPSIALTGAILASNAAELAASGNISETGGTLDTGSLNFEAGNVTLVDGANQFAAVTGTGSGVTLVDQEALSVGNLSATGLALTAPAIGFAGNVSASARLSLDSPGAVMQTGGSISAGTLASVGSVGATALNQPGNAVATLGGYTASSFALVDSTALDVTGPLAANSAALSAAGIALNAAVTVPGVLTLGGSGGVTQNVAIRAGTLAGALGGDAELGNAANSIATLGDLSAGGTLNLADATPLSIAGAVSAAAANLTADGISLTGSLLTSGATQLASTGGITEAASGTLSAASLSGTDSGGDVTLPGANSIVSLGGFSFGSGSFGLSDAVPLTVAGALTGAAASLAAPGLTLAGDIAASNALTLASAAGGATQTSGGINTPDLILDTGGSSALAGNANTIASLSGNAGAVTLIDQEALGVSDLTAGDALLTAPVLALGSGLDVPGVLALDSAGSVTQSAAITAGTLAGSLGGDADFTQAGNAVGTLGGFSATSLRLFDGSPLTVAGPVDANTLVLNAPSMAFSGNVTAGTLALSGTGGISQSGGGINTPFLSIATAGAAALTGNGNTIASVTGSAGAVALTDQEALNVSDLNASDLELTAPGIVLGSGIDVSGLLALASPGGITQSAAITAGTLGSGGATDGAVNLGAIGNQIGTLGSLDASSLTLEDAHQLVIAGPVDAGAINLFDNSGIAFAGNVSAGTLALSSIGGVSQSGGGITAGTLTTGTGPALGSTVLGGGNAISTIAGFIASGFTLNDTTPLTLADLVEGTNIALNAPGITINGQVDASGILQLSGDGTVAEGGTGEVSARELTTGSGIIIGNAALGNTGNQIGTLGNFAASGNLDLGDGEALNIDGLIQLGGALVLADPDSVTQTGGVLSAATLAGSAGTLASFGEAGATADIATLGSFSLADSLFELNDGEALTIIGPVVANTVLINAAGALLLDGSAGGGLLITGGLAPAGAALPPTAKQSELSASSISAAGTFDINTGQTGATIFVVTANGGSIALGSNGGLQAPGADVILAAGTQGSVTGNVNAAQLEILSAKSVNLTGLINGVGGAPAAALVGSVPGPSPVYLYNSCPIAVANCGIQAVQQTATTVTAENPVNKLFTPILTANPLENFDISQRKRRRLNKDVQLPGVATHDF